MVPYDYDLEANPSKIAYHGVFISNGPGDPAMCTSTIESLRWLMKKAADGEKPVPIFGICLGNQLLALAAGAKVRIEMWSIFRALPGFCGGCLRRCLFVGCVCGGSS